MTRPSLCLTLLTFFVLLPTNPLRAGDAALDLADSLLKMGNTDEAITEYKRFICFNPADPRVSEAYYRMGLAYRRQRKWEEALSALRHSLATAVGDSLRGERRISIGIILLVSQRYSAAEFDLLRVSSFSKSPYLQQRALFFLGICYLYTFQWAQAQKAFHQYFPPSKKTGQLDSLFTEASHLKYKSPSLAKWLSTFLPGMGQIYAGDWLNGLNALAINGLTSYLLLDALVERRYQDALLSHLSLFERYYRGNRQRAEKMARDHNEHLNRLWAEQIIEDLRDGKKRQ